ncbi:MAG TPA: hypothetical protein PKD64_06115 [Pirellulaceae bacterium]|nr:hypothetical protein [Pirellulaceae bacterium]HMO91755.1 hypothetical protein [Pirellulaceae bacterium]HMP69554.1 hypothetical protein [Pirellulaceae bacterium]
MAWAANDATVSSSSLELLHNFTLGKMMNRSAVWFCFLQLAIGSSAFICAQESDQSDRLRTLDDHFPLRISDDITLEKWTVRSEELKEHILSSLGLLPLPQKKPLHAVIHGKLEMDDYTVEKVFFESFPGYFVTGNLYRPKNHQGKTAGVLCPHGHYANGRFHKSSDQEIERMLASGEERFAANARCPLQARCIHLARMGCTVFHYDMIGYADSIQIPFNIAHGFRTQRAHMNDASSYGFFSPLAELNLQSIMGLQTWNSIRSLDFLLTLDEVDPARIGVTGSSGGGTQTFILGAIDSRPTVAFPAVMVSTGMQGGCTCENCCNLRIETGNVEFAAMFAPRPLGVSAANDWTLNMKSDGYPQIQHVYALYGATDKLSFVETRDFPHGFNVVARESMYELFDKYLQLNGSVTEREIRPLSAEQLTVWNDEYPRPASSELAEYNVLAAWSAQQANKITEAFGDEPGLSLEERRTSQRTLRHYFKKLIETAAPLSSSAEELRAAQDIAAGLLPRVNEQAGDSNSEKTAEILMLFTDSGSGDADDNNHAIDQHASTREQLEKWRTEHGLPSEVYLLDMAVLLGGQAATNRLVDNGREAAGYTYGYNRSLLARQIIAVRNAVHHALQRTSLFSGEGFKVTLIALDDSALPVAFAAATSEFSEVVDFQLALCTDGRRWANVDSLIHRDFLPGGLKYGDVPRLLTLLSPHRIVVFDDGDDLEVLRAQYGHFNAPHALRIEARANGTEMLHSSLNHFLANE